MLLRPIVAENPETANVSPVELLLLTAAKPPKIRSELGLPRQINGNRTRMMAPAALGTLAMPAPPTSPAAGSGSGVDWAAEARRALRAYEIRNRRPPRDTLVSGESEDEWLRQLEHHAGDQMRTPKGDWILWVNADCYQVAKSEAGPYTAVYAPPPTYCLDRSRHSEH